MRTIKGGLRVVFTPEGACEDEFRNRMIESSIEKLSRYLRKHLPDNITEDEGYRQGFQYRMTVKVEFSALDRNKEGYAQWPMT